MLTELTAVTDQLNAERDRGVTEKNAQRAKMTELEGSKEELKANEQRLQQRANTIQQHAAMAQVKIVMKGVMKGEQCRMLHQWRASAVAAKQAEQLLSYGSKCDDLMQKVQVAQTEQEEKLRGSRAEKMQLMECVQLFGCLAV